MHPFGLERAPGGSPRGIRGLASNLLVLWPRDCGLLLHLPGVPSGESSYEERLAFDHPPGAFGVDPARVRPGPAIAFPVRFAGYGTPTNLFGSPSTSPSQACSPATIAAGCPASSASSGPAPSAPGLIPSGCQNAAAIAPTTTPGAPAAAPIEAGPCGATRTAPHLASGRASGGPADVAPGRTSGAAAQLASRCPTELATGSPTQQPNPSSARSARPRAAGGCAEFAPRIFVFPGGWLPIGRRTNHFAPLGRS